LMSVNHYYFLVRASISSVSCVGGVVGTKRRSLLLILILLCNSKISLSVLALSGTCSSTSKGLTLIRASLKSPEGCCRPQLRSLRWQVDLWFVVPPACWLRKTKEICDLLQLFNLHRLLQHRVHSAIQRCINLFRPSVRRHRHNERLKCILKIEHMSNLIRRLISIHNWHIAVHQDKAVAASLVAIGSKIIFYLLDGLRST